MLRAHVLASGALPDSVMAARFRRRGLAGLVSCPASVAADPVFSGEVIGARRPPWSPHDDPRLEALAAGFAVLLGACDQQKEAEDETVTIERGRTS
jgi:hypothetical protein